MRIKEAFGQGMMDTLRKLRVPDAFSPSHLGEMFRRGMIGAPGAWGDYADQLRGGTLHKPGGLLHQSLNMRNPDGSLDYGRAALTVGLPVGLGAYSVSQAPKEHRGYALGSTVGSIAGSMLGAPLGGVGATALGTLGASAGAHLGHAADRLLGNG